MRRTRYTVTLRSEGETTASTQQILTYSPDAAQRYFLECGHAVLRVETTRAHARRRAGQWRLDPHRLAEVIDFFGLKLPVYVNFTSGVGTHGTHALRPGWHLRGPGGDDRRKRTHNGRVANGGLYHHVTLSRAHDAATAGRALWHELAHAMQAERTITESGVPLVDALSALRVWSEDDRRAREIDYRRRPCEVEARSYEPHAAELNPCAA